MRYYTLLPILLAISASALAQSQQYTTPVPILKQINKHNEDGSYSYGYEGADGSYKIESKYPNGEVFGKYGYVDNLGKLREIEYGASRRGFEPQGNDVNVAPPTLTNDKYPAKPLGPNEEDDGQYREDPAVYYKDDKYNNQPRQSLYSHGFFDSRYGDTRFPQANQQPTYQQPAYQQPAYQQPAYQQPAYQAQPAFRPVTKFSFDDFINQQPQAQADPQPQPQPQPQPSYYTPPAQPQSFYNPPGQPQYYTPPHQPQYYNNYNPTPAPVYPTYAGSQLSGVPATNVNLDLGSYSVNYKRR